MFEIYILPIIIFAAVGLIAGALLTLASKVFEVKIDERIQKVTDALPGINCGACGYSGCEPYAEAVVSGEAPSNLCKPGGDPTSEKISEILGTGYLDVTEHVAYVRCGGDCEATDEKFEYTGIKTCSAVDRFYSGKGQCKHGCPGYGDCVDECMFDAISIEDGIAVIDSEKCTGCGMCAPACPNDLIVMKDATKVIDVKCSSTDTGKVTRINCDNGCIGCKICERKCEYDAIKVVDNLASIDYDKCTLCGVCVEVCPVKCIHNG